MAGRGTDIVLGDKVAELGGLYVIGTTRHEARRIDNQLRGRAGRQGDPGSSRFFISLEDDLLVRFGVAGNPDIESVQRTAESQNLEIRQTLWKYESVIEYHRQEVHALRREMLLSGRSVELAVIDDLWADYLANIAELRGGIHWVSWGGRDPLHSFLTGAEEIYADFYVRLNQEIAEAFASAEIRDGEIRFLDEDRFERGATWTYLTTDQPFGTLGERIAKAIRQRFLKR
jgi:preprotein translocase subunit SecA